MDLGDSLTYSAVIRNGNWLSFNPTTRTFTGTPTNDDIGSPLNIKIIATDRHGEKAEDSFTIDVLDINDAPFVNQPITDKVAIEDKRFSFTFSPRTFKDLDRGDSLTYSASLADDSPLPTWLTFNAVKREFRGTPADGDAGVLNLKVKATDSQGLFSESAFKLTVLNVVQGTLRNDILMGTANDDYIVGGGGADNLTGNEGKDRFVYNNLNEGGDIITDFDINGDRLNLSRLFDSVESQGLGAITNGYVQWEQVASGMSIQVDPDGNLGSQNSIPFILLENVSSLTANNFIL